MKRVKLTFNHDWPIFNQTPGNLGVWDDFEFILNGDDTQEYDFWVILGNYKFETQEVRCPKGNIVFIATEPFSIENYEEKFLTQFPLFITVQKELAHLPNAIYTTNALPWHVKSKSYDELISMSPVKKTRGISIITSNKEMNDGHKKRLEFAFQAKERFGDQIDLFGRGINDFDDKWEVLAPYKYSIAIENDFIDHWVTEKFYDCLLAYVFPFYYGCPNLGDYIRQDTFERIDIMDVDNTFRHIERILADETHYARYIKSIEDAREKYLNHDQFFPFIAGVLRKRCLEKKVVNNKIKTSRDCKASISFIDKARADCRRWTEKIKSRTKRFAK